MKSGLFILAACVLLDVDAKAELSPFDQLMLMVERDIVVATARIKNGGAVNEAITEASQRLRVVADRELVTFGQESMDIEEIHYMDLSVRIKDTRFSRLEDVRRTWKVWNREVQLKIGYVRSIAIPPGRCIVVLKHMFSHTGEPLVLHRILSVEDKAAATAILVRRSEMESAADEEASRILEQIPKEEGQ